MDLLTNAINTGDGANSEALETLAGNILTSLTSLKNSLDDGNTRMVTSLDTGDTRVSTPTDPGLNLLSGNLLSRLAALEKELIATGPSVSPKRQTRRG